VPRAIGLISLQAKQPLGTTTLFGVFAAGRYTPFPVSVTPQDVAASPGGIAF
jgi:hypothetical protein